MLICIVQLIVQCHFFQDFFIAYVAYFIIIFLQTYSFISVSKINDLRVYTIGSIIIFFYIKLSKIIYKNKFILQCSF